jgi:phage host-nuclease inhibitor protein Gam
MNANDEYQDHPLSEQPPNPYDLVVRLRTRAEIRRQITTRKSVQNNEPDRISDLLEEAASEIEALREEVKKYEKHIAVRYLEELRDEQRTSSNTL